MPLSHFGQLAAAEIAVYFPVLCFAFFVILKKGVRRREGWIYLFTFSLIRMCGGCVSLAFEVEKNPPVGLFIAVTVLQGIGVASLLLATMGFVSTITQYGSSATRDVQIGRLIRVILLVGIILRIVGASDQPSNENASTSSESRSLTRVGSILFLLAYCGLFALHIVLWREKDGLPLNHRKLLRGVSLALPPLFVRILYTIFGAFASSSRSRWSPLTGAWGIYLAMGLIMEYLVVCVYVVTGALTSMDTDDKPKTRDSQVSMPILGGDSYHSRGVSQ